jgi:hypothetical protein
MGKGETVRLKSLRVTREYALRVSMGHEWGGTDLSGLKLENFNLIRVGLRGYDPHEWAKDWSGWVMVNGAGQFFF